MSRTARFGWSLGLGGVLVLATFVSAWFFGGTFVLPLRPGEFVGRIVQRILGGSGGAGFYQVLFLLVNALFWSAIFFGVFTILGFRRRRRMDD